MLKEITYIKDIHFLGSNLNSVVAVKEMYEKGIFHHATLSDNLTTEIPGLAENIKSPLKRRMSQLSLGIYQVLQNGGAKNLRGNDEIYLFTAFAEIATSDKIIADLELEKNTLVSPVAFHNSVHNTPLGYYTIINKCHNYCLAVSDGMNTGRSFVDLIKYLVLINPEFVIAAGDEYSSFYNLEIKHKYLLFPFFTSYKMVRANDEKGFFLRLESSSWQELFAHLQEYEHIIADKDSFIALEGKTKAELLTDYPIVADAPLSIASRLAFPFALELSGKTAVIGHDNDGYFLFEVVL